MYQPGNCIHSVWKMYITAYTLELGLFGHTAPSHGWDQNVKLKSEIRRDLCAR